MRARLRGQDVIEYPRGKYPEYDLWDEMAEDWWWADRFNWPPSVVDDLPIDTFVRLRSIDNVAMGIRKAAQER